MSNADDLAPLLEELAATLDELRGELDDERPRRFRDLVRFTEQYTIPAIIAILETNIRLLELTAGAIRLADGRLGEPDGPGRRDVAFDALERGLDDLSGALRGDPTDPEARKLLEEARDLRREVRGRVAAAREPESDGSADATATTSDSQSYRVPVEQEREAHEEHDERAEREANEVDVDAEIETIKRELQGDADEHSGEN